MRVLRKLIFIGALVDQFRPARTRCILATTDVEMGRWLLAFDKRNFFSARSLGTASFTEFNFLTFA